MMTSRTLGRYGVWRGRQDVDPQLAADLERLGFGTLWLGGSPSGDLHDVDPLLEATATLTVATGIVNIWQGDPHRTAESFARVEQRFPGRFLLGVGTGHREATREYEQPYAALAGYVDVLLDDGVAPDALVLAALGPRVLRLAAERTSGAHPYLVPPEHTALARATLGPDRLLAPEHKVVLDPDPQRARALGRAKVDNPYLGLRNYTNNLRRLGWSDADLARPGSDALIDALVAHGSGDSVAQQLERHFAAGADHVAVQLLLDPQADVSRGFETLAAALQL